MTFFLFYRRSGWFLFPLAAAVAFHLLWPSGVHFPSSTGDRRDSSRGQGYAIAFVILVQQLWNFVGRRMFPELCPAAWPCPEKGDQSLCGSHRNRAMAAAGVCCHFSRAHRTVDLPERARHQARTRRIPMALVETSGALVLQQVARHRLHSVGRHPSVRRPGARRAFSRGICGHSKFHRTRFMVRELGGRAAFALLLITFAVPLLTVGSF